LLKYAALTNYTSHITITLDIIL